MNLWKTIPVIFKGANREEYMLTQQEARKNEMHRADVDK